MFRAVNCFYQIIENASCVPQPGRCCLRNCKAKSPGLPLQQPRGTLMPEFYTATRVNLQRGGLFDAVPYRSGTSNTNDIPARIGRFSCIDRAEFIRAINKLDDSS